MLLALSHCDAHTDLDAPVSVGGAAAAHAPSALLQALEAVLARGDPALDARLLEVPVRAYGGRPDNDDFALPAMPD
jgi:hypothetical protein